MDIKGDNSGKSDTHCPPRTETLSFANGRILQRTGLNNLGRKFPVPYGLALVDGGGAVEQRVLALKAARVQGLEPLVLLQRQPSPPRRRQRRVSAQLERRLHVASDAAEAAGVAAREGVRPPVGAAERLLEALQEFGVHEAVGDGVATGGEVRHQLHQRHAETSENRVHLPGM